MLDHRPDVLDQLDVHAHPEQGQHDVGEHHRRVDIVTADRLQRHLRAEIGLVADLEEGVSLPDLAVLRQRAAGRADQTGVRSVGSDALHGRSGSAMGPVGYRAWAVGGIRSLPAAGGAARVRHTALRAGPAPARVVLGDAGTARGARAPLGVKLLSLARRPGQRDRLGRIRVTSTADRTGQTRWKSGSFLRAATPGIDSRPRRAAVLRRGRLVTRAGGRGGAPDCRASARRVVHGGSDATGRGGAERRRKRSSSRTRSQPRCAGALPDPDWSSRVLDARRRVRRGRRLVETRDRALQP